MIDSEERKRLADAILALWEERLTWDDFANYYDHLRSADIAVYKIGWYFWVTFDPEFPTNRNTLSPAVLQRSILFLHSPQEYSRAAFGSAYWPFPTYQNYEEAYGHKKRGPPGDPVARKKEVPGSKEHHDGTIENSGTTLFTNESARGGEMNMADQKEHLLLKGKQALYGLGTFLGMLFCAVLVAAGTDGAATAESEMTGCAALAAGDWSAAAAWVEKSPERWGAMNRDAALPDAVAFMEALGKSEGCPESYWLCAKTIMAWSAADFGEVGNRVAALEGLERMLRTADGWLNAMSRVGMGPFQWPDEVRLAAIGALEEAQERLQRRLEDKDTFAQELLKPKLPPVPPGAFVIVSGRSVNGTWAPGFEEALGAYRKQCAEEDLLVRERRALNDLKRSCEIRLKVLEPSRRREKEEGTPHPGHQGP